MVTEEKSPTATSGDWTDGAEAFTRDFVCAYANISDLYQTYYNYGFNIPAGSIINQVLIKPYHAESRGEGLDVRISWDGGITWSAWATIEIEGLCVASDVDIIDATGLTDWTPEKLSDTNFRVQVKSRPVLAGCFKMGSLITMWDGSKKKIEDVKIGDEVLSWRPRSWLTKSIVTVITRHQYLKPVKIIEIKTKKNSLALTPNHSVCISSDHRFKDADTITTKDFLVTRENEEVPIIKITKVSVKELVNIQVSKQLLFVNGFLVHNIVKKPW